MADSDLPAAGSHSASPPGCHAQADPSTSDALKSPVLSGLALRPFTRCHSALLVGVVLLGAGARVFYQIGRPWVGDEIGTLRHIEKGYAYLLTHFEPWLTMNYFLVLQKCLAETFGPSVPVLTALPLVCGVAAIVLTALVCRRLLPAGPGLMASLLVACNPYLIRKSVEIRSYSALFALALLALLAFLRWAHRPCYRRGVAFAVVALLLVLMHPNGVYPLMALGLVAIIVLVRECRARSSAFSLRDTLRRYTTLSLPTLVAAVAAAGAYAEIYPRMAATHAGFMQSPPSELYYLPNLWRAYFGRGFVAWPPAILLGAALWFAVDRKHPVRILLPILFVAPVVLALQGVAHFPHAYARLLVFALPVLLILIAYASWESMRRTRRSLGYLLVAAVIVGCWFPTFARLNARKHDYPWGELRKYVDAHSAQGNIVVGLEFIVCHNMDPRPATSSYERVSLDELDAETIEPPVIDGRKRRAFLLVRNVVPATHRKMERFGNLTLVTYEVTDYRQLVRDIRDDLERTVRDALPSTPAYLPVYSGIILANRRLGRHTEQVYFEMRDVTDTKRKAASYPPAQLRRTRSEREARQWRNRLE